MNIPLALSFEATNSLDLIEWQVLISAAVMVLAVTVVILLDKFERISISSVSMVLVAGLSFTVASIVVAVIITVSGAESNSEKRTNNIEKAYEGVEVIDHTYKNKDERVVTLLVDGQTVTATLREDPDTFEPTLYPYASEDAVKLEKVS